jgi:UDP-N-acetylglucosamine 2-epimerase (non-hydrolysing)
MADSKETTIQPGFWQKIEGDPRKHVHLVMIATKPDIIKQAPIYLELKKRGELVFLGHTGQHYDFNLSGGLEQEFGIKPDFNLNISGPLHQKIAEIIQRLGDILAQVRKRGKIAIPYVHGDTTTAMACSNAAFANEFASVHVEAGIRTLTPKFKSFELRAASFEFEKWREFLSKRENWERGSIEPYPEQFNTRTTEPATGLFCAPVELDREFLLGEGNRPERIKVVGNSVYDATLIAEANAKKSTVLEKFPMIKKGFIRFCIHRRENCSDPKRFTTIFEAMEKLVNEGENVLLISLFQTKFAIETFGLQGRLEAMMKKPNFVYSDVWPYYTDVIAAMKKATVCATDSGSMQEEMNILGIPCVTLRFGSDRSETILAGCNVIAPPIDSDLIVKIILSAKNHKAMKKVPSLYGQNVSQKIVDETLKLIEREPLFCFEQDRLKF